MTAYCTAAQEAREGTRPALRLLFLVAPEAQLLAEAAEGQRGKTPTISTIQTGQAGIMEAAEEEAKVPNTRPQVPEGMEAQVAAQ